jgi:hypothetical protein
MGRSQRYADDMQTSNRNWDSTNAVIVRGAGSAVYLLCLLLLAGCSGLPTAFEPPVAVDVGNGRRSIGVISTIGLKFAAQKVGVTVFGNAYNDVPIGSWGIDDAVSGKLEGLLRADADVKRIRYQEDAFAAYAAPGGLFRDHNAELVEALRKITANQKCDLYLVVVPSSSSFGSSNQVVNGLGIVQGGSVFASRTWIHALFQMRLYDGRTLQLLGWKPARLADATFMPAIHGPHRQVDPSLWTEAGRLESNLQLKTAMRELLEQALTATLPEVLTLERSKRG